MPLRTSALSPPAVISPVKRKDTPPMDKRATSEASLRLVGSEVGGGSREPEQRDVGGQRDGERAGGRQTRDARVPGGGRALHVLKRTAIKPHERCREGRVVGDGVLEVHPSKVDGSNGKAGE